ncbi:S-layer homology domain-containing protein [Bacillus sp. SM2101]|uniref:S-layer homology domain-containing protein n=1 Tax=Bacillus sp. SM2101 TaxID=2805366 RepID=UPI001BDF203E|nr:S-layer homology domain-containing protein [Bacillus sp. SM2101]
MKKILLNIFVVTLMIFGSVLPVFAEGKSNLHAEADKEAYIQGEKDGMNSRLNDSIPLTNEDEPPGDEPPGDEPPGDEPPGDEPPGDEPPGDEPPGDDPNEPNHEMTVTTNELSYFIGDTVEIYGVVTDGDTPVEAAEVTITIEQDNNEVYNDVTSTDHNGHFVFNYGSMDLGNHVVTVEIGEALATTSFEVIEEEVPVEEVVVVSVGTDSNTYHPGEAVVISGTVTKDGEPAVQIPVTITVKKNGTVIESLGQEVTNATGTFTDTYTLQGNAAEGEYEVSVTAVDVTDTATFEVEEVDEVPLKEVTVSTNKTKYAQGSSVSIFGKVKKDGSAAKQITVTIKVMDSTGAIIYTDQAKTNNEGTYSSTWSLGADQTLGTYSVEVTSVGIKETTSFIVEPTPGSGSGGVGIPKPGNPTEDEEGSEVIEGELKVVIEESDIIDDLNDETKKDIEIDIEASGAENATTVSAEIKKTILNKIVKNSKSLVINTGKTTIKLSPETIKGITEIAGEDVLISVKIGQAADITAPEVVEGQIIVSDVFDITIHSVVNDKQISITEFNEPIEVSIQFDRSLVEDTRKVAGYYLNEKNNEWEYVGGKVKDDLVVFYTMHLSKYAAITNDKTFADIVGWDWAKDQIEVLASRAIIKGKSTNEYAPGDNLTRAQFAVLIVRALNIPTEEYKGTFSDIPESLTWSALEIEAAQRAGIVTGRADGTYGPNENITREQMATMIIRAVTYKQPALLEGVSTELTFTDAHMIEAYAKDSVAIAAKLGILKGKEDGTFAPKDSATRAQAAVLLYNLLTKLGEF